MSGFIPEDINNEKYIELTVNIDNAQFTIISLTGVIEIKEIESAKKYSNLHYHDCYESFCIEDGTMTLKLENETVSYGKNDFFVISPYVNHTVLENNVTNKYRERILFSIKKNSLKNCYPMYERLSAILDVPCLHLKVTSDICNNFKLLKDTLTKRDTLMSSLHFHKIIAGIIRTTKEAESSASSSFMPDSVASRSHKIHTMINQYYTSDISLEYIAENLNLSTRQVSRFIKQHYGCTYRELVTEMRMKTAMELVLSTKLTITEIAMEVGFKSTKGFYKSFKSYYGRLPTDFRKDMSAASQNIQ